MGKNIICWTFSSVVFRSFLLKSCRCCCGARHERRFDLKPIWAPYYRLDPISIFFSCSPRSYYFFRPSKGKNHWEWRMIFHLPFVWQSHLSCNTDSPTSIFVLKKKRKSLFPPGIEPGTLRVWGARDNHYTTKTQILYWKISHIFFVRKLKMSQILFTDSSKGQSSTRFSNNADDLTYHTDNEMKRQNYLSKSSAENSDRNGKFAVNHHQQSKESYKGSSYFSNSAHSANKTITNQTLMLLLLLMMATYSSSSSYIAMSSC